MIHNFGVIQHMQANIYARQWDLAADGSGNIPYLSIEVHPKLGVVKSEVVKSEVVVYITWTQVARGIGIAAH